MKTLSVVIVVAAMLLVGAFLFYDRSQSACEGIYQQSALRLGGQLETISAKGGLLIGREKLQELSDGAQKVGQHLRTCCAVLDAGRISTEQFQTCVAGAGQYEARLVQVANTVEQASSAQNAGNSALAEQKAGQVEALVDQASQRVEDLTRQVGSLTAAGAPTTDAPTAAEPNDTPAQATPLTAASAIAARIDADDRDYYRFHHAGTVRDQVEVRLENRSTTLKPQLFVYDAAKSELLSAYDTTAGADLGRQLVMEKDSDYYVEVRALGGDGEYALTVKPLHVADANEPNDDAFGASALAIGQPTEGGILDGSDADWFRITGLPPGRHSVRVENLSTTLLPRLTVYNADKQEVANGYQTTAGANVTVAVEAETAQDWFVRVMAFSGPGGAYRLSIQP